MVLKIKKHFRQRRYVFYIQNLSQFVLCKFVFYAVILSFKLEASGPRRAENRDLDFDGRLEKVKYPDDEIWMSVMV